MSFVRVEIKPGKTILFVREIDEVGCGVSGSWSGSFDVENSQPNSECLFYVREIIDGDNSIKAFEAPLCELTEGFNLLPDGIFAHRDLFGIGLVSFFFVLGSEEGC